ncbi:MAG: peptidase domain-containing ABC transporter [bacterium]
MSYPFYNQYDSKDCGPTCLRMVAKFYGKTFPQHYIKSTSYQKRSGTTLLGLSDAAEKLGFRTVGVKITWEQLASEVNMPCIVNWNQKHFVVVYRIEKDKIIVGDPAQGILKYDKKTFLTSWYSIVDDIKGKMGIVLLLEPTPSFYNSEDVKENKINFRHLLKYLKPHTKYLLNIALGILVGSVLSLIFPLLTQSIVDVGIGNNDLNFIIIILVAQVALIIGQAANSLIKNWLMLHLTTRVNISLVSDFLGKLMRLPIAFFDSKKVGDLLQRIGDFGRIQTFLTEVLISISMAIVGFVVYSFIMLGYNGFIFAVFLLGSILYIAWILIFLKRRRKLDYMRFQESASNQSSIIQIINGMQDIKLSNCEKKKQWEWEKIQVKLYDISIKGLTLAQTQHIGGLFIDQLKNMLITFIAAKSVLNGNMTLGMMIALQYIIGQLNAPVYQFVQFIQSTQDTKISLERLNEIQMIEDEEPKDIAKINEIPPNADIVLKDVIFQYDGPRSRKVLNNINLTIQANNTTAIVGVSGSGKTTLLKLILGFYEPSHGVVLLNNIPIKNYSDREWRHNCGVVMQEGVIFSDTIINNIGASDDNIDFSKVERAVNVANLKQFIEALPLGFNTQIGVEGNGISTGQKQRILIARAIYKDANYILFDEATNSLDANNELVIMNNLSKAFYGKTAVIVAHRLSTVKNADNIIVLDNGVIVEQGDHNELIKRKGHYFNLVKNQLELGS